MNIEWSISLGNIITSGLTLLGFVVAAFGFFYALKSSIALQAMQTDILAGRMINVENEIKKLSEVVVSMAAADQRMTGHTRRMDAMDRDAQEWRTWVRGQFDAIHEELRGRRRG